MRDHQMCPWIGAIDVDIDDNLHQKNNEGSNRVSEMSSESRTIFIRIVLLILLILLILQLCVYSKEYLQINGGSAGHTSIITSHHSNYMPQARWSAGLGNDTVVCTVCNRGMGVEWGHFEAWRKITLLSINTSSCDVDVAYAVTLSRTCPYYMSCLRQISSTTVVVLIGTIILYLLQVHDLLVELYRRALRTQYHSIIQDVQ